MSQRKYTLDLLKDAGALGGKTAKMPMEDGYKVPRKGELEDSKPLQDPKLYRKLVGKLIYLTITRPDICFAVNQVSQHMQTPKEHHWGMVERILMYLNGASGQGVWLGCNKSTEVVIPVSQFGNSTASSSFQSNQDESLGKKLDLDT
ncbi:hypothetical protein Bca101_101223 [Brassica carinata]